VNHNFKSNGLNYVNTNCFTLPKAPADPALASQCVPFGFSPPGSKKPNPGIAGTCSNLLGNAGRNSIVGPKLVNLDFSVYKNFALNKISESSSLQFRAEFFNIMNHANFGVPAAFYWRWYRPDFQSQRIGVPRRGTTAPADGDETQGHSVGVEANLVKQRRGHSRGTLFGRVSAWTTRSRDSQHSRIKPGR